MLLIKRLCLDSCLQSLYDPSQSLTTTWKPNVSFCEWTGVICSRRRQRVVSLNVSSMGLQGTISPLLGNLSFLRILDLSNNSFHGHIPYQLGNLFRLKMLYLSLNQLQGSIPPTLGGCRSLRNLTLSYITISQETFPQNYVFSPSYNSLT
jgi:LRR receptor-like serine/threonine-protein kinase FLS2